MSTAPNLLRSSRFRAEREADWRRLEELIVAAEKRGVGSLGFRQAQELVALYRQAAAALSVAREISLDVGPVAYLESLSARAYLIVYAPRVSLGGVLSRFFAQGAPQAMRRSGLAVAVAFIGLIFGGLLAFAAVSADPTWYHSLVPAELAGGRGPEAAAETLRRALYDEDPGSLGTLGAFATSLFSHNTQVALFSFALGVVVCVPTMLLSVYNGAVMGAFFAIHAQKGLAFDLFAWLSIHGVTELSAIAIAMAGGLKLGHAVLFPGFETRGEALRHAARDATKLAVVAALMLFAAGVLEGFGRQLVTNPYARLAVGWGVGLLWLSWFVLAGRGEAEGDRDGPGEAP
ncbi:stage II sporulation protein M [Mangrovicella endophytica]|uniref:stage II sporulation protein M n=1 Tax=Mangrovicella endophytica TaxID=2066697 RepID=UPI000C9EB1F7|nr:stage II sporulation protein M [Mangrovicella endophytica]